MTLVTCRNCFTALLMGLEGPYCPTCREREFKHADLRWPTREPHLTFAIEVELWKPKDVDERENYPPLPPPDAKVIETR